MRLLNLQSFEVERPATATEEYYDDTGKLVSATPESPNLEIKGSLQPVTGKDLQLLPDGFKHTDVRKLYTKTKLFTTDEDAGTSPDYLIIDGNRYQVQTVEQWTGVRLSHYKVMVSKVEKK